MDPLAALLSERPPPQLSATELRFRIALLEEAARACRVELESRTTGLTSPAKLATQLERSDLGIGPLAEKTGCFDVTLANTGYLARGGRRGGKKVHLGNFATLRGCRRDGWRRRKLQRRLRHR